MKELPRQIVMVGEGVCILCGELNINVGNSQEFTCQYCKNLTRSATLQDALDICEKSFEKSINNEETA